MNLFDTFAAVFLCSCSGDGADGVGGICQYTLRKGGIPRRKKEKREVRGTTPGYVVRED